MVVKMSLACPDCKYELLGMPMATVEGDGVLRCPECGRKTSREEIESLRLAMPQRLWFGMVAALSCGVGFVLYAMLASALYANGWRSCGGPYPWDIAAWVSCLVMLAALPWVLVCTSLRLSAPKLIGHFLLAYTIIIGWLLIRIIVVNFL